jgi:membrane protease YdiL (CAAX protease family)
MSEVSGKRLGVAVAVGAGLGVAAGVSTAYALPALAPAWGDTDRLATVIVLEAYLAVIVGHVVAFGGFEGLRTRLRIAPTSSRQCIAAAAVWIAILAAAAVLYFVLSAFAWPFTEVASALLWIGADGGRLADAEPLLFVLAAGRAIVIAPFAEELLFRGSLFGWLRGRLPAFATILITASVFALGHPMPVLWPAALLFGIGAAWFRERSGSVTPFILVHVMNNLALTAISYWVTGWHVPNLLDPAWVTR